MLEVGYFLCDCMPGKLFEHDFDIDQAITATVHQYDRRLDVSCWKLCHSVISVTRTKAQRRLHIVVKHLEAFVSYYLKPMYHALCACERVQVGVCSELLVDIDVFP